MKVRGVLSIFGGAPSFFDLFVMGLMFMLVWFDIKILQSTLVHGMVLVYGTIILMCYSLVIHKKRNFISLPLALLVLWTMYKMFAHSLFGTGEVAKAWFNWCVMNEGFIYILFGVLLVKTVADNAKSPRWYCIPAAIIMIHAIVFKGFDVATGGYIGWSMTPIMATGIAALFIFWKLKIKEVVIPLGILYGAISIWKFEWLKYKFVIRPIMWRVVLTDIKESWLGEGWGHSINAIHGFIYSGDHYGWGWIHNDLLELGKYMGVPAVILVAWFFLWLLWRSKPSLIYFFVLSACIASMFQRTMFFAERAGVVLIMVGGLIVESRLAKNFSPAKLKERKEEDYG